MQALRPLIVSLALLASAGLALGAEPAPSSDPITVLNQALANASDDKLADAAKQHLWFHDNAVRLAPSTAELRLTFALQEWVKLARRYPPALEDLHRVRDAAAERVIALKTDVTEPFLEVVRINEILGEPQSTRRVFAELGQRDETQAARFLLFALPALAETQDHLLALRYLQVNQVLQTVEGQLNAMRNMQGQNPQAKASLDVQRGRYFDLTIARVVWVLMKSSMPDQAKDVARRGKALLQAEGATPLTDAALRGDPLPASNT
jgi:hypothetical protein